MNIEVKYYYVTPMTSAQALAKQAREVNNNPLMTAYEKDQARMRLKAQREGLSRSVVNALASDWATVKSEYQTLRREKAGAADRAARSWDFQRLEYARKAAHDFMQSASIEAINKRYEALDLAGDKHALRGFVEEGIAALTTRKFTDREMTQSGILKGDMEKVFEQLTLTQEQRDLARQGEILTDKIAGLYQATEQAKAIFAARDPQEIQAAQDQGTQMEAYQLENDRRRQFEGLGAGISIRETVDHELVTHRTVTGLENWD